MNCLTWWDPRWPSDRCRSRNKRGNAPSSVSKKIWIQSRGVYETNIGHIVITRIAKVSCVYGPMLQILSWVMYQLTSSMMLIPSLLEIYGTLELGRRQHPVKLFWVWLVGDCLSLGEDAKVILYKICQLFLHDGGVWSSKKNEDWPLRANPLSYLVCH